MWESDVAHYGSTLWLGPAFLVGYLLLVGWLMNAPLTKWGARRIKERRAREKRRAQRSEGLLRASRGSIAAQAGTRRRPTPRWSPPERQ